MGNVVTVQSIRGNPKQYTYNYDCDQLLELGESYRGSAHDGMHFVSMGYFTVVSKRFLPSRVKSSIVLAKPVSPYEKELIECKQKEAKRYNEWRKNMANYEVPLKELFSKADIELLFERPNTSNTFNPIASLKNIIFSSRKTIALWDDGTKTIISCQPGDTFDKEKGIALVFMKKFCGNKSEYNEVLKKYQEKDREN